MGEGRCIILATVLKVHNAVPLYPYCQRCYSKLELKSKKILWQCNQCSNTVKDGEVNYRFRLSMTIGDTHGVADMSVFGQQLHSIFGSTANTFQKYLKHVEDSHLDIDINSLLQSAESNSLIGNQFYFGINIAQNYSKYQIKGLNDLVEHYSKVNKSIVACQAIEPFQSSQNMNILQYLKHSIHCLTKSIIAPSCSSALCICKCSEETRRKQSFRKSNSFICSAESTRSNTQRKLSTNSLAISYEESFQKTLSQQSTASNAVHQSFIKGVHVQPDDEICTQSFKNDNIETVNLTDNDENEYFNQDRTVETCIDVRQDSEPAIFSDDLPFSEDLEMFLQKVDANHALENAIKKMKPNQEPSNVSISAYTDQNKTSDSLSEHHSKDSKEEHVDLLPVNVSPIKNSDPTNESYLNELPFSEELELYFQDLENYKNTESPVLIKVSGDHTKEYVDLAGKENQPLCSSKPVKESIGHVSNLKRRLSSYRMVEPCGYSTPIHPGSLSKRAAFKSSYATIINRKQTEQKAAMDTHVLEGQRLQPSCRFSTPKYKNIKTSLKDCHKIHLNTKANQMGDNKVGGNLSLNSEGDVQMRTPADCDLQEVSDCSPDLFSSQSSSVFASGSAISKSVKKTRSLSKDLMEKMLKLKQTETHRHDSKMKPNSLPQKTDDMNNSDIFTQPLFDSPNEVSSCFISFGTNKIPTNLKRNLSKHNFPKEELGLKVKHSSQTEVLEPLSNQLSTPDLFSQPFCHSTSRISNNFDGSPDLFSSWCETTHPSKAIDNNSLVKDFRTDNSLSIQLFSEDSD